MMSAVAQVAVPDITELAELERIDYTDAFSVATDAGLSPERWLRLFLQGSPLAVRVPVMGVFLAAGAQPAWPLNSDASTLGWRLISTTADHCVAEIHARIGLTGRLMVLTPPGRAVIVTAVQLDTNAARRTWVVGQRLHRRVARVFLANAARLARRTA
ncbi:MAG: hypothetical protein QOF35_1037 [Actinomycetota bacterium]|jgi:hypothetical protein|nr:hypothetical protein [Actinomycetota bacterium]